MKSIGIKFRRTFVILALALLLIFIIIITANIIHKKTAAIPVVANYSTTQREMTTAQPKIDKTQWNLILVNKWNELPEDY